jgi:hypothetical protein
MNRKRLPSVSAENAADAKERLRVGWVRRRGHGEWLFIHDPERAQTKYP